MLLLILGMLTIGIFYEKLAHMNPLAAIKCMCGMCHEKLKDLTCEFPTKKNL